MFKTATAFAEPLMAQRGGGARLYLLLVIPILLALNLVFVPFHAPDDYDHLKRAYTLEHGAILPVTQPGKTAGGYIDAGLARMIEIQKPVIDHWPRRGPVLPRGHDSASPRSMDLHWTNRQVFSESGAAVYLPLIYLPQAAALWLGERFNLTIYNSVLAARLANGLVAASIVAVLLVDLPFGIASVLLLFLLPKTLLQFASNSADPILHALTLAITVFSARALVYGWAPRTRHFLLLSFCMLVLVGTRPPMALLAPLPLWVAWRQRNIVGAIALVVAIAIAAAWFVSAFPHGVADARCGATGTLGQKLLLFVTHGPFLIAHSLWQFRRYYFGSFIGELGWGNGPGNQFDPLPFWVYVAVIPMILSAVVYDMGRTFRPPAAFRDVSLLCGVGIAAAIFFTMYAGCTKLGSQVIGGVQGRYFVATALLAIPAFSGIARPSKLIERFYPPALVLFTFATFATLISEGLRIYWISQ